MAAGRACSVTDIGLPVEDMKTAVVVPPKDVGALTEAIELLAQNAELREDLGRNARRFIEENCNIKKDVEEHLVVFEEVAKRVHGV
jgi:glycosyltransferase involved in cell wall biosynthesis